jgi:hypothetical protein
MARTGDVLHSCRPPISTLTQASGAGFFGHLSDAGSLAALVMQICASWAQVKGTNAASKKEAGRILMQIPPMDDLHKEYALWVLFFGFW